MSNKYYVGGALVSSTIYKPSSPISRVTLAVDEENVFTAGDDTGAEISASCPYATQSMVDALLLALQGKIYHAYNANAVDIDPLAELGDGVTVDGIYSMLATIDDDGMGFPDIGAAGDDELDDEYPVKGAIERKVDRNMAKTRSLIAKTSEAITLRIEGAEGDISELELTLDGVTITDESGTTRIKGSSIDTETLNANSIAADKLYLTGSITWDDFSDSAKSRIDSGKGDSNPSYIKRTYIGETKIMSPDIYAGMFYATGKGADAGAAYYIYDGCDISGGTATLGTEIGFISYDTTGDGESEAKNRVLFTTLADTALKINAAGNMSIEAHDLIYLNSPLVLRKNVHFGKTLPSTGTWGQLFFIPAEA